MSEALEAYGEKRELEAKLEIATKMLEAGYEPETVASITELPIEKVLELAGLVVDITMDDTRTSDFFTVRYVRADDHERLARIEKSD